MNPLAVNSSNVLNFGFTATFKLFEKQIHFNFSQLTTFVSGHAGNVQGIYIRVVDPTGITIKEIDLATRDLSPTGSLLFDVAIPSAIFGFGWYKITAQLKDQDGTLSTITLTKNICLPDNFNQNGFIDGTIQALTNCYTPSIKISETTAFTYLEKAPASLVKSGHFYYPQGTLSPVAFTFTPFSIIGSGQVYTGDYLVKNTSTAQYDQLDNVYVEIQYQSNFKFSMVCNSSLNSILCCVQDLNDTYYSDPMSTRGIDAKTKLDKAGPLLWQAIVNEKIGQDASAQVEQLKIILNCDCKFTTGLLEPIALGVDNNDPVIVQLQQAGGITVDASTTGNTTNYTISCKVVQFTKADSGDLNFSISVVQSQYGTVYSIAFDYTALAETLLNTIIGSDDLTALFKSIIGSAITGVDLSGLTNNCVININNCNYLLVEVNNVPKTVVSITINNTAHNAPSMLLLSNTSGVQTWLNGLSLGTFSVALDGASNTISIVSNANSRNIQTLIFTAGTSTTRQFTRTCAALVDVLNAITTYICALDGTDIEFGSTGVTLKTLNNDLTVNSTPVQAYASLAGVLSSVISAQNTLIDKISSLGFNCTNVKALFQFVDKTVLPTDGVLGIKGGLCALMTNDEYVALMLTKIAASTDLKSALCGLTSGCGGAVCAPVTNVSGVLTSGNLVINANDFVTGTAPTQYRYRINNSGNTFTTVTNTAAAFPVTVGSLAATQWEVQIRQQCANGVWSPWAAAVSNNPCAVPSLFTVAISGSNFVVTANLPSPATKIEVTMTDPNGGVSVAVYDLGSSSGTQNIAIPVGIYGNYSFKGRTVCTASPLFASDFTNNVNVVNTNPTSNNIKLSASFGLAITNTVNGTGSGIPTSFNGATVTGNLYDYTPGLANGTYVVTISGTIPGTPVYLRLVRNGTDIRSNVAISAAGDITLTNAGGLISYPDTISIEIDS